MGTTAGWSIDARRKAIHQVLQVLLDAGMDAPAAHRYLANRTNYQLNTVQGWFSLGAETRQPPIWSVLDVLRVEAGLVAPTPLLPGIKLLAPDEKPPKVSIQKRPNLRSVQKPGASKQNKAAS